MNRSFSVPFETGVFGAYPLDMERQGRGFWARQAVWLAISIAIAIGVGLLALWLFGPNGLPFGPRG